MKRLYTFPDNYKIKSYDPNGKEVEVDVSGLQVEIDDKAEEYEDIEVSILLQQLCKSQGFNRKNVFLCEQTVTKKDDQTFEAIQATMQEIRKNANDEIEVCILYHTFGHFQVLALKISSENKIEVNLIDSSTQTDDASGKEQAEEAKKNVVEKILKNPPYEVISCKYNKPYTQSGEKKVTFEGLETTEVDNDYATSDCGVYSLQSIYNICDSGIDEAVKWKPSWQPNEIGNGKQIVALGAELRAIHAVKAAIFESDFFRGINEDSFEKIKERTEQAKKIPTSEEILTEFEKKFNKAQKDLHDLAIEFDQQNNQKVTKTSAGEIPQASDKVQIKDKKDSKAPSIILSDAYQQISEFKKLELISKIAQNCKTVEEKATVISYLFALDNVIKETISSKRSEKNTKISANAKALSKAKKDLSNAASKITIEQKKQLEHDFREQSSAFLKNEVASFKHKIEIRNLQKTAAEKKRNVEPSADLSKLFIGDYKLEQIIKNTDDEIINLRISIDAINETIEELEKANEANETEDKIANLVKEFFDSLSNSKRLNKPLIFGLLSDAINIPQQNTFLNSLLNKILDEALRRKNLTEGDSDSLSLEAWDNFNQMIYYQSPKDSNYVRTPLDVAVANGSVEIVKKLIALGADPNAVMDYSGNLYEYRFTGTSINQHPIFKEILDSNYELNQYLQIIGTKHGLTHLDLAMLRGDEKMVNA
ncbi:MAG: hypothetical protein SFV53_06250, partial [Rickettsiales bacterium]|nr:hypothetical protein [Rickettsiales bacterium]